MRRFVIVGQRARSDPDFSLLDLPSTSGRLDVLLRAIRAALLYSHGVRLDTTIYLVLLGGERPRTVRITGEHVRFLRPDERSLAILLQKTLRETVPGLGFETVRPGIALAEGGLEAVFADLGPVPLILLDAAGEDLRSAPIAAGTAFFLGDQLGVPDTIREALASRAAATVSAGPIDLHTEDALTIVVNELDRRGLAGPWSG